MQFRKWLLVILAVGTIAPLVASAQIQTVMPGEIRQKVPAEATVAAMSYPLQLSTLPVTSFTLLSADDAAPDLYLFGWETSGQVPLRWGEVDWATVYHIQVARNENFSQIVQDDDTLTVPEVIYLSSTYDNDKYYWRVRAGEGNGKWGLWSATSSFVVNNERYSTATPTPMPTASFTPSPTFTPTPTDTPTATPTPGG